jgi:hypothetical protein
MIVVRVLSSVEEKLRIFDEASFYGQTLSWKRKKVIKGLPRKSKKDRK